MNPTDAAPFPAPPEAMAVVSRLRDAGFGAFFAGGCVRDHLRGVPPHDFDIATSARPDEVESLFPGRSDLVGKSFGVAIVREGSLRFEVATFRADGPYSDGRHPDSVTFTSAEEDARRRDFTVNALFYDPFALRVLDHTGGVADLAARRLRAVGDPARRFAEDKLRLLRAVRFAANLGFEIEPATWDALRRMAPEIAVVSAERIRDELDKWLTGPDPARGLDLLDASGLLDVLLPEVAALRGVDQPPEFHPEGDVFVHTRLMLSHLRNAGSVLAWSVLLHDIGKPPTRTVDANGRIRFNGHETEGARMAAGLLRRLRFPNNHADAITACVVNHMAFKDVPRMKVSTLKKLMARPTFPDELALHRIDCLGSHGQLDIHRMLEEKRAEFASEPIQPEPLVRGADLLDLGLPPGPKLGAILREAYDLQLEGALATREAALAWLRNRLL